MHLYILQNKLYIIYTIFNKNFLSICLFYLSMLEPLKKKPHLPNLISGLKKGKGMDAKVHRSL